MAGTSAWRMSTPAVPVADSLVRRKAPDGDLRVWFSLQRSARRLQYKWIEETKPSPMDAGQASGSLMRLIEEKLKSLGYLESMEGRHTGELFDLEHDPAEHTDLFEPELPEKLEDVKRRLQSAARGENRS